MRQTNQRDKIDCNFDEKGSRTGQLERQNKDTEKQMSLKDIIKAIFNKYGFTYTLVTVKF